MLKCGPPWAVQAPPAADSDSKEEAPQKPKKAKGSSKKGKKEVGFADLPDEHAEEELSAAAAASQAKPKKGKRGKKAISFADLPSDDEGAGANQPAATAASDSEGELQLPAKKGKKGKKAAISFADLPSDDEGEGAAQPAAAAASDSEGELQLPAKKGKKSKQGNKAAISFADLPSDDAQEAAQASSLPMAAPEASLMEAAANGAAAAAESDDEELQLGRKKKKKGKKGAFVLPAELEGDDATAGAAGAPHLKLNAVSYCPHATGPSCREGSAHTMFESRLTTFFDQDFLCSPEQLISFAIQLPRQHMLYHRL